MKRSIPGFVMGLITSIFCLFWGFITAVIGDLGTSIGGTSEATIVMILGWICFLGGILGIIGASLCFKNAKTGAILLTISTVACGSLLIYMFVKTVGVAMTGSTIMIYLVPVALFIAATICAYLGKPYQPKPVNPYYNQNMQQNGYYQPNYNPYGQQYGFNPNMNNQQNGYYPNNQNNQNNNQYNQYNQPNYTNNPNNNQSFENNNNQNNNQ